MDSWEIAGESVVEFDGGERHECESVVVFSPMGIETWLYVDRETRDLVLAEQIDGEWTDIDLDYARERFADVLYAVM